MTMRDREGLIARIRLMRRVPAAGDRAARDRQDTRAADPEVRAADPEVDAFSALETRVKHLERLVEGLQDSVHRESERHSKLIADLQAQIEPGAMGAALAEDARNRGL
jgi:hypothetical protein